MGTLSHTPHIRQHLSNHGRPGWCRWGCGGSVKGNYGVWEREGNLQSPFHTPWAQALPTRNPLCSVIPRGSCGHVPLAPWKDHSSCHWANSQRTVRPRRRAPRNSSPTHEHRWELVGTLTNPAWTRTAPGTPSHTAAPTPCAAHTALPRVPARFITAISSFTSV